MKTQIGIHLLLFCAFITLHYGFSHEDFSILEELKKNPHERSRLLANLLIYAFLYLGYYILIPKYVFAKRYVVFAIIALSSLSTIIIFSKSINWFGTPPKPPFHTENAPPPHWNNNDHTFLPPFDAKPRDKKPPFWGTDMIQVVLLFLIGLFLTISLRFAQKWQQTEKEKLQSELLYLKAQINPHFLFNTINALFASALDEKAPKTADSLIKLSNMMRYIASESSKELVPLEREINYIQHYIELQKMRFSSTLYVQFEAKGDTEGRFIAPMILINFVENAFKFGISPEADSPIFIKMDVVNNDLYFLVNNKKYNTKTFESTNLGLVNTRQRLELLYPNKHLLTINDSQDNYAVSLHLTL